MNEPAPVTTTWIDGIASIERLPGGRLLMVFVENEYSLDGSGEVVARKVVARLMGARENAETTMRQLAFAISPLAS